MLKVLRKINCEWCKVEVIFHIWAFYMKLLHLAAGGFIFEMAPRAITLTFFLPVSDKSNYSKRQ